MSALTVHRADAAGWERRDLDVPVNVARFREGLRRTESIWRNLAAVAAWQQARLQQPLFVE